MSRLQPSPRWSCRCPVRCQRRPRRSADGFSGLTPADSGRCQRRERGSWSWLRLRPTTCGSQSASAAIVDAAFDLLGRSDPARQFMAMTTVGDWTLLIEPNGCLCVTEDKALPASAGTRWVSHFVNINGLGSFLWAEDTAKRLMFEPGLPDRRCGTTPDELLDAMHHSGFQFGDETSDTAEPWPWKQHSPSPAAPDGRAHHAGTPTGHHLRLRKHGDQVSA
ncbi:DUF6461 domain-containing protein [Streptomyces sp. NPDC048415]|uniref:DUF6461 domain-containing protein n=1 Tax=Streptomyces sp. NPDC048415 TaxID=3154822 RepID=UPI003429F883